MQTEAILALEPASARPRAPVDLDVPRDGWPGFFRRLVARHRGTLVRVRTQRPMPLHDVRCGRRADGREEILIMLGEPPYMLEPFFLVEPLRVRVQEGRRSSFVLCIEAQGRTVTFVLELGPGRRTGPLALVQTSNTETFECK